ncbi:hypothetical protein Hanom_Chr06g00523781 [Helianthus anomalus]
MQKTYGTLSAIERERLAIHEGFESTHTRLHRCLLTSRVCRESCSHRVEQGRELSWSHVDVSLSASTHCLHNQKT